MPFNIKSQEVNMKTFEPLTDLQWEKLKNLFPVPPKRGRGKPHSPWRSVVNSILFVLLERAKWGSWPQTEDFASKSAAHRWYLHWDKNEMLNQILEILRDFKPDCEVAMPQRRTHSIREAMSAEEPIVDIPLYIDIEKRESSLAQ